MALRLDATYLVWLDCAGLGVSAAELVERMLREGLVLSPGADFCSAGLADQYMRINVACPRATINEAVCRLRRVAASPRLAADAAWGDGMPVAPKPAANPLSRSISALT